MHSPLAAAGGGLAAAVTCPLDVIKTVLNTQQKPLAWELNHLSAPPTRCTTRTLVTAASPAATAQFTASYRGVLDTTRTIYAQRGLAGFFKGFQARILVSMPSTAISWSVYELFKYYLIMTET